MEQKSANFKHIVRIANTDIDGNKKIAGALLRIKGVGYMFANALFAISGIDKSKLIGDISDSEMEKINDILKNPLKYDLPLWMLNRRRDPEDASVQHLLSTDIKYIQENDIKMMKKMRTFKGVRHMAGLPVRGQRTRAHFRKVGRKALGVKKTSPAKKAGK
ncbi:MAG: 30S ribosomal protein S13 [Candidatus Woesearchaeota archaeon]|jgi:small subunit ribosomal protein S13